MKPVQCLLVEDNGRAQDLVRMFFGPNGSPAGLPGLQLNHALLRPFEGTPNTRKQTLLEIADATSNLSGPLILLIDFDLGLDNQDVRREVRELIERRIGRQLPGAIDRQMDGLLVAVEAIANVNLRPLLIVLTTGYGGHDELKETLDLFATSVKRVNDIAIVVSFEARSFSRAGTKQQNEGTESALKYIGDIFRVALQEFRARFETSFDSFLAMLDDGTVHRSLLTDSETVCARLLCHLLQLDPQEFREEIWKKWNPTPPDAKETILKMGRRDQFSAASAWLYALAAFLHSGDTRKWTSVFNAADISDKRLSSCHLTAPQTPSTIRTTVRCFYEMCRELMFADLTRSNLSVSSTSLSGPLVKACVSYDVGLSILLGFDCGKAAPDRDFSLLEQIGRWRDASLGLASGDEPGTRTSSHATWRYWMAATLGDSPLPCEKESINGAFGTPYIWKMNVFRKPDSQTEVIFRAH